MKFVHCLRLVSLLALAAPSQAFGQDGTLDNPQLENARALIQETQEALIRNDLRLTAEEEEGFWPLWEEYRAATLPTRDRYVLLIAEYLRRYDAGTLDDDYAGKVLADYFEIRIGLLETRESYVDRFADVLPMLKVARLYQLENKLMADVDAELALLVPLFDGS
jgi:hypothetical protein